MFPAAPIRMGDGEGEAGLTYSGVYVAADRARLLGSLGELRFTGYVGPQEGTWVLAVAGNALGTVARGRRHIADVARDLAGTLGVVTLAVEVERDLRLRLQAFDSDAALPPYDSRPQGADDDGITLDPFGMPVMLAEAFVDHTDVAEALLTAFGVSDDDDALVELLDDDLGEDTNESERLVSVLRLLGLPTWIVSSDSLPRRVPGGPERDEVTRLRSGRTGVQGSLAAALTRPARRKATHIDD